MSVCQLGRPEGRPGHSWESNVIVTGTEVGCELFVYLLDGKFQ
jgi:hypothetical protein